jgi:hypothetical protein
MESALFWGGKQSLLRYLAEIGDGRVDASQGAGAALDEGFVFPIVHADWAGPGSAGEIHAVGSVTLYGHGIRMGEIADPRVIFEAQHATLLVRRWANRDAMLSVAEFAPAEVVEVDGRLVWPTITLLESGRELFDFRYDAGTALAPISFSASVIRQV